MPSLIRTRVLEIIVSSVPQARRICDGEGYYVRDGIVIIPKNAIIPIQLSKNGRHLSNSNAAIVKQASADTEEQLRESPSGDLFGLTQSAGMGWDPAALRGDPYLILNTHGSSGR